MGLQILLNTIPSDTINKKIREDFEQYKQQAANLKRYVIWKPYFAEYLGVELFFM